MKRNVRHWARQPLLTIGELWQLLVGKRLAVVLVLAGLLALAVLWPYVKALLIMAFFVLLGAASMLYNRFIRVSLGVELNMMGMVITGMLYGAGPAIAVGMVTFFLASLFNEHLTHAYVVSFSAMIVVGLLIPVFAGRGITTAGIILTLIFDTMIVPGYLYLGSNPGRVALFVGTHLPFNVWVFFVVAPRILGMVQ